MDDEIFQFSVDSLRGNTLKRSKNWSKLLNKAAQLEDDEEIDLEKIEEYYKSENKEIDHPSSDDNMAEEADPIEDLGEEMNSSVQNVTAIAHNLTVCSSAHGILTQINKKVNETGILDTEIQRVLEDTLPIMEQYLRSSRDSGFESVLNTFDLVKIEDKADEWMRLNNSTSSQSFSSPEEYRQRDWERERERGFHRKGKFFYGHGKEYEHYESDSDSLHSVDTARYIRSSKVHKRISTKMTTIKSYCLVESKRDELRRKYAYLIADDSMQMFKKERFRQPHVKRQSFDDIYRVDKSVRYARQRQRYRRERQTASISYSSSEDESFERKKGKKVKSLCCAGRNPCSNWSLKSVRRNQYSNDDGGLPYLHEAECTCKGAIKLCKNIRHLANSSFEDWLVENCQSPKKETPEIIVAETKYKRDVSEEPSSCSKNKISEGKDANIKPNKKTKSEKSSKPNEKHTKKESNTQAQAGEKEEEEDDDNDSSFERELQRAIKLSKQEYKENRRKRKSSDVSHTDTKLANQLEAELKVDETVDDHPHKTKKSNNVKKSSTKTKESGSLSPNLSSSTTLNERKPDSEASDKKELNPKKPTWKAKSASTKLMKKSGLNAISEESEAAPLIVDLNEQNASAVQLREQTNCPLDYTALFSNSGRLCNSTALANNTATSRQLDIDRSVQKVRSKPVNKLKNGNSLTANEIEGQDLKDLEPSVPLKKAAQADHVDCTHSSPAIDGDLQTTKIPTRKKSCKADNSIVLYTPTNPSLAPSHSISNGRFKLTEDHLASILGPKIASKFMKYYVGPKNFNDSSTVYYIPPAPDTANQSSDSDIDFIELCLRYGNVVETRQRTQTPSAKM